ncbi:Os05g0372866 [Oryza sativa Japonica Group]|jgi:hypothetical protein|uniref:Os05g0372866 protein n=1 Tax=Oryza sativa subsp. japonica TaxID=39947 RepID=A0A0N7KKN4_ORYSJ|nr:hypothetical protein EE612_029083 [Oryza sativa]BAS93705.1 Os05g0372866 [Oryza sativa Japonica Group]
MVTERRRGGVQMSISTKAMIAATRSPMRLNAASSSDSSVQHTLPMSALAEKDQRTNLLVIGGMLKQDESGS